MVNQTSTDTLEFRVFMPDASSVELVGSFTGWRERAIPMKRSEDGWWTATLDVEAGDHEFQYLVDGHHWLADYAAGGLRMNKYGTWVSLLHVPLDEEPYIFEQAAEQPMYQIEQPLRLAA